MAGSEKTMRRRGRRGGPDRQRGVDAGAYFNAQNGRVRWARPLLLFARGIEGAWASAGARPRTRGPPTRRSGDRTMAFTRYLYRNPWQELDQLTSRLGQVFSGGMPDSANGGSWL